MIRVMLLCGLLYAYQGVHAMTGIDNGFLSPCPSSPNCVCSDESSQDHKIEPYSLMESAETVWQSLLDILEAQKDMRIITSNDNYIHIEARSKIFRFVDDVEFHLRPESHEIAIRSASRTGYSDFSVNRKRLERIRGLLLEKGLLKEK